MNENGSNASDVRKRQAVYVLLHIVAIRVNYRCSGKVINLKYYERGSAFVP
jgi:predicted RNase H-like nuclease